MAETPIIKIGTEEAVRNVADLKNNIKELKKQLDDASTSTEEYAHLTSELSKNQAALRNVMNGTNSTFETSIRDAAGLSTSYNSLVQQLKTAAQEWRTIPKYLSDADKAQGVVNKAWTEAAIKVEKLRMSLKDMDAATGNFTRNVGNYKSALDGFQGVMSNVKQVGGDMSNGIAAVSNMMVLAGANTDGLSASMKNFQTVLALTQGAKGLAGLVKSLLNFVKGSKAATTATKANTTATKADAAAMTADAAATSTATVATTAFGAALKAIGIGLIVSAISLLVTNLEDVAKWFAKVGESLGLWKRRTNEAKEANDALNKKMEEQNRAFDLNARLQQAQGVEQKKILQDKLKLIKSYINEKNAIIAAANARIEEIKGHTWLQRVLNGENRERRQLLKDIEKYQEEVKNLSNQAEEIEIDIKVEDANKGRDAAQKAAQKQAEKAAAALKLAQDTIKKGSDVATKALQKEETAAETVERQYKANKKAIEDAIKVYKDMKFTGSTEEIAKQEEKRAASVKVLTDGLKALNQQYYSEKYLAGFAEAEAKVTEQTELQYRGAEKRQKILKDVLGLNDREVEGLGLVSKELERQYNTLKAQKEILANDIEPDILANIKLYSGMTAEQLEKELGQPAATALQKYFEKSAELENVGTTIVASIASKYRDAFQEALDRGEFTLASAGKMGIVGGFINEMEDFLKENGLSDALIPAVREQFDRVWAEAINNNPMPIADVTDILFPEDTKQALEQQLESTKTLLAGAMQRLNDAIANGDNPKYIDALQVNVSKLTESVAILEERLNNFNIGRFGQQFQYMNKVLATFGKATSNLMDNVADAWEAALQAQVKSGKKSEEQAKKTFEGVKILQYASAVINTSAAVVQALADPTTPNYYIKAANAAAALAAGIAQTIKIKNTEFSASMSSTASNSSPELVDRTPQLQYTIGLNAADYAYEMAQYPTRAYVVDKDLSDGLRNYNRRGEETTF